MLSIGYLQARDLAQATFISLLRFMTNDSVKTKMMVNALVQAIEPIQVAAGEMIIRQGQLVQEILPAYSASVRSRAR
jgi:membrane-associated HD superfamily phosphohydrolase